VVLVSSATGAAAPTKEHIIMATKSNANAKPATAKVAKGNRKFATKTGERSKTVLKKVDSMRKAGNSWATIATALEIAPRTARRMFDEVNGEGAHHGLLPGKGGRTVAPAAEAE
jgi:hypothetical protein